MDRTVPEVDAPRRKVSQWREMETDALRLVGAVRGVGVLIGAHDPSAHDPVPSDLESLMQIVAEQAGFLESNIDYAGSQLNEDAGRLSGALRSLGLLLGTLDPKADDPRPSDLHWLFQMIVEHAEMVYDGIRQMLGGTHQVAAHG